MDAQQFLAEFGHVANAPGGIDRLRVLILQLAVAGDLVSVEPQVEDLQLLERIIQQKRDHGEKKKVIPKQASVPLGMVNAPSHWNVCRLGDIALTITGGGTPSKSHPEYWHGDIPWASVKDLKDFQYLEGTEDHITKEGLRNSSANLIPPGRVIVCTRMGLGKAAINRVAMAINQDLKALELPEDIDPDFFLLVYKTREVKGAGMTVAGIKQDKLLALPVAIPPKEEQSRIVAKVDELIALCDQLEQQQQDRRKLQNALRQSTLQALASAHSPYELQTSWQRLQASFGQLFSEPADVDDVVAELRNLAVRGVLVEAGRSVADLAGITADCSALRSAYIATGLMRRQKLVGMAESDMSYPQNWAVAGFDEVAVVIGGVTKGRDLRGKQVVVCPYLAVANVQRGYFKLEGLKLIEIAKDELPKYLVHEGDLLITEGGDWDKVGRTAIWEGGVENCLHQNHVFKARIPSEKLLKAWVELVFNSGIGRNYFAGASKQTTNLASINMTQLRSFPLPIPPVDEQRRILDALATLTDLCEEWRRQLKHKGDLASLFAVASVAALTGINIEKNEDTVVKAPQTELVAPLLLAMPPDVKAQAPLATILVRHQGEMTARDLWQRFGGEIDAFYAQLKTEVARGWIAEPEVAQVREKAAAEAAKA